MNNDVKTQLCRDDFYFMLENAMIQAGGGLAIDKMKKMTLSEIVAFLPQNGIRMVYMPEKHMNAIKIVWEDPTKNNNIPFTPPNQPYSTPKKKQLLCDQFGVDLGEENPDHEKSKFGGYYGG